jgi:hypothetical protein
MIKTIAAAAIITAAASFSFVGIAQAEDFPATPMNSGPPSMGMMQQPMAQPMAAPMEGQPMMHKRMMHRHMTKKMMMRKKMMMKKEM